MFCKNCGNKLDEDALFCMNCGVKVAADASSKYCAHCGNELEADAVFCMECGNRIHEVQKEPEKGTKPEPENVKEETAESTEQNEEPVNNLSSADVASENGNEVASVHDGISEEEYPEEEPQKNSELKTSASTYSTTQEISGKVDFQRNDDTGKSSDTESTIDNIDVVKENDSANQAKDINVGKTLAAVFVLIIIILVIIGLMQNG